MRRLAGTLVLALATLPGCMLVAGQDGTDAGWVWHADEFNMSGTGTASLNDLEARVAALEAKVAQCPQCQDAAEAEDDTPFAYDIY